MIDTPGGIRKDATCFLFDKLRIPSIMSFVAQHIMNAWEIVNE